jgi:arylsulfatase A-like enzyme/MFS family permease
VRPRSPFAAFAGIFVVTLLSLTAVGAVLPVLPRYVRGPLDSGDLAVGFVIGAFAFTALASRPVAGRIADTRGRRPVVVAGALLASAAGGLYFLPGGLPSLLLARLVLGAGEGAVFTAGATWVVDLAPEGRRGRVIGLYGLAVWGGLSLGPPIGDALLRASSFDAVWAFTAISPLIGALVALQLPDPFRPDSPRARHPFIARESIGPGAALSLATVGYAAMASFIVLDLDAQGAGHGAIAFTAFAVTVVFTRLAGGDLPDRVGPLRCAAVAAAVEAAGLTMIAVANGLALALCGAVAMGAAFALLYPSLSLVVVNRVPEERRGSAIGTFTAFFDLGVGLGAPLAGAAAAVAGYPAAFWLGAAGGLASGIVIAFGLRDRRVAVAALLAVGALALGACGGGTSHEPRPRAAAGSPNVIVVMTDDQDTQSVGVMNAVEHDLAAKGVTFSHNFVTTPECCPSRATFLTGQYAHNHGVLSSQPPEGGYQKLTDRSNILPVWLQDAGYETAYFGKYLNGYGIASQGSPPTEVPDGWDDWHAPVDHTEYQMYGYTLNENGELHTYGNDPSDYETDVLSGEASIYVARAARGDRPFFMVVAPLAPHGEGVLEGQPDVTRDPRPAPRDLGAFDSLSVPRPPSFDEADLSDKPVATRKRASQTKEVVEGPQIEADYRGRVESLLSVDDLVARLVRTLRETGQLDDTYILFTSDNGFMLGQHGLTGKDFPYEESAGVPLIVRGPGLPGGATRSDLVANIDLAPTILDMANASPGRELDGTSLLRIAKGNGRLHRDLLIEFPVGAKGYTAIRTPRWMYAEYTEGDAELYDLRRDPYELDNLAGDPAYDAVRAKLGARLDSLRDCAGEACR